MNAECLSPSIGDIADECNIEFNRFNYKIINELAYTGDNILIYNLFVSNLPRTAIMDHFNKFGKILNVLFLGGYKGHLIYFEHPGDAAKALQAGEYKNVIPLPCCSSMQPEGQRLIKQLSRIYETSEYENYWSDLNIMNREPLILSLNDDCLGEICKALPIVDQVSFALTCHRFYDIMVIVSKVEYLNFSTDIIQESSMLKTRMFLLLVGSQIKNMEICRNFITFIQAKLLGTFCINVEKLQIYSLTYAHSYSCSFILNSKMQQLRELELYNIHINDFKESLKYIENLKNVCIANCDIKNNFIILPNWIEKLSLINFSYLKPNVLTYTCKHLKNLYYLDVRSFKNFMIPAINESTIEWMLQLKVLKINFSPGLFNYLTQLPNLKHLEIVIDVCQITDDFIYKLSKLHATQLDELELFIIGEKLNNETAIKIAKLKNLKTLHCCCYGLHNKTLLVLSQLPELEEFGLQQPGGINDEGILKFIGKCLKLKHLYLCNDYQYTANLIKGAEKLLREQVIHSLRAHRLHLHCRYPKENFVNYGATDVLKISSGKSKVVEYLLYGNKTYHYF